MKTEPNKANGISPAPNTMPTLIDQKRKAISNGSLIALLKRTMERAPTIPRESTIFEVTARIIKVVISVSTKRETQKLCEYITPLNVFCKPP